MCCSVTGGEGGRSRHAARPPYIPIGCMGERFQDLVPSTALLRHWNIPHPKYNNSQLDEKKKKRKKPIPAAMSRVFGRFFPLKPAITA